MDRFGLWGVVAAGGVAGTLARAAIFAISPGASESAPDLLATGFVNVIGAGLLGWAMVRLVDEPTRRFVCLGFCGGVSTMSTLAVDAARLLDQGGALKMSAYVLASVAAGLGAFVAGRRIATQ